MDGVRYSDEHHLAARARLHGDVLYPGRPLDKSADPQVSVKLEPSARPHAARQFDRRQEAAALGVAVRTQFALPFAGQEIEPMRERWDATVRPWRRLVIEQRRQTAQRRRSDDFAARLAAPDPVAEVRSSRHQYDFGSPSTCVATWLRIRLVEIGATW
jgi:hypothetical protein